MHCCFMETSLLDVRGLAYALARTMGRRKGVPYNKWFLTQQATWIPDEELVDLDIWHPACNRETSLNGLKVFTWVHLQIGRA